MSVPSAAAIAVTATLALVAAGCGGSPGSHVAQLGRTTTRTGHSSSAASALENGAVAFSRCMRSHGVSSFPDPASGGSIPKVGLEQLGVTAARFQAAHRACDHLLPNGGQPTLSAIQEVRALSLSFAQCVRAHGFANFPDPGRDGRIPDPETVGIDQGSPLFQAANLACAKYRPPYMPSNSAYNAWARTNGQ
ncbi:MAG TPA: hypothetical protein VH063_02030 [Gaiellaceae bacterium]|nr:hypothetical protein [Gaiellaceae bacterium]